MHTERVVQIAFYHALFISKIIRVAESYMDQWTIKYNAWAWRCVRVTAAVVLPVIHDTLDPVPIVAQVIANLGAIVVCAVVNYGARLMQGLHSRW